MIRIMLWTIWIASILNAINIEDKLISATIYKISEIELREEKDEKRQWLKVDYNLAERTIQISIMKEEAIKKLIKNLTIDKLTKKDQNTNVRNQYSLFYLTQDGITRWELYDTKNKKQIEISQKTAEEFYRAKSKIIH